MGSKRNRLVRILADTHMPQASGNEN
ncbi:hypothetical protein ACHAWF_009305 [Thalassiosira exigua]